MNIFKPLLNVVLPPRCPYCAEIVEDENCLCLSCFQKINFISEPYCKICGLPFENESEITKEMLCPNCLSQKKITRLNRSAIIYDDFSKQALLALKFKDKTENARVFAKWLKIAGQDIFKLGIDTIVPVPLSYQRLVKRHYNQAALLAQELSKFVGIPVDLFSLKKIKHTKPQAMLQEKDRWHNIKQVFKVENITNIQGKHILLIDDIMTTGATLNECAKTLLNSGAHSVDTLTVARTLK